jgi:hypothetical protein
MVLVLFDILVAAGVLVAIGVVGEGIESGRLGGGFFFFFVGPLCGTYLT